MKNRYANKNPHELNRKILIVFFTRLLFGARGTWGDPGQGQSSDHWMLAHNENMHRYILLLYVQEVVTRPKILNRTILSK